MFKKITGNIAFLFLLALILSSMALVATAAEQDSSSQQMQATSAKVDINSATVEQLQALPGIGPALAQRIVEHREMQGPFKSIEGIKAVKGVGEKKFESIQAMITVSQS